MLLFDQRLSLEKEFLSSVCKLVRSGVGIVAMSTLRRNTVGRVDELKRGDAFENGEYGQELRR